MKLMEMNDLKRLAYAAARKVPMTFSVNGTEESFSAENVNDVLRAQFELLAPDYKGFRRNQNAIFELIEETIDEILPRQVMQQYEQFADVRVLSQGDKAVFRQKVSEAARKRAKTFVTKVGLAGRYEVFMLDGQEVEVQMGAIGGACRIGFEEFLDGRIQFGDLTSIILEGMDEYIYREILNALDASMTQLPNNNKATFNGFDEGLMDNLLAISDSYGSGNSTIYCVREFASQMLPATGYISNEMKNTLWERGYLGDYKGHRVIILQQSTVDTTNTTKAINPRHAYIIPSGLEKPVKLAFEGPTAVRLEDHNDDWSQDLQTYKKFGIAVFMNPAICRYTNSKLNTTF